ncbi:MAG: thiamine-binding protein [Oscillospiraceae bacterium]|nr:thiamine-binding protein [Oscillospiraceae bacterium]
MNTLISVSIYPMSAGETLSAHVAEVIKVIEASGLPSRTTSMATEMEGEWDDVMKVVKDATFVLANKGFRTGVALRADIRPGYINTLKSKVEKLDSILGDKRACDNKRIEE